MSKVKSDDIPNQREIVDVTNNAEQKAKEVSQKQYVVDKLRGMLDTGTVPQGQRLPGTAIIKKKLDELEPVLAQSKLDLEVAQNAVGILPNAAPTRTEEIPASDSTGIDHKQQPNNKWFPNGFTGDSEKEVEHNMKQKWSQSADVPTSESQTREQYEEHYNRQPPADDKDSEGIFTAEDANGSKPGFTIEGTPEDTAPIHRIDDDEGTVPDNRHFFAPAKLKHQDDDDGWFAAGIPDNPDMTAKDELSLQRADMKKAAEDFKNEGCLDIPFEDNEQKECKDYNAFDCHSEKGTRKFQRPVIRNKVLQEQLGPGKIWARKACCHCGGGLRGDAGRSMISLQENWLSHLRAHGGHSEVWWKSHSESDEESAGDKAVDKALDETVKRVTKTEHKRESSSSVSDTVRKDSAIMSDMGRWEIWAFLGIFICVCGSVGILGALSFFFRSPKVFNETYT